MNYFCLVPGWLHVKRISSVDKLYISSEVQILFTPGQFRSHVSVYLVSRAFSDTFTSAELTVERSTEVKASSKWAFIVLLLGSMLNNSGGGVYFARVKSWKYVTSFGNALNLS